MSSIATPLHAWNRHPEDKDQRILRTPYGRGLAVKTRKQDENGQNQIMREIQLLDWDPLTPPSSHKPQKKPTLYSVVDYKSVRPMVGDDVICLYGRGRVISISHNNTCVVKLTSWRLAGRSLVTCHLSLDAVGVVRKKTLQEMSAYERVSFAQTKKAEATRLFGEKQFEKALVAYAVAVDAIRYVQHDANSNNELRADLLVVMITCCNNAGTCSVQLEKWDEAIKFAKNALVLLDALYEKRGLKIHTILNRDGFSDAKLFGEWRVKSYLLMVRGLTEKGEYNEALSCLKTAHSLVAEYTKDKEEICPSGKNLFSQEKQLKKLHNTVIQQKKAIKQKEKEQAVAMFGNNSKKSNTETTTASTLTDSAASPSSVLDIKDDAGASRDVGQVNKKQRAPNSPQMSKRVSFSEVDQIKEFETEDFEDEGLPWYDEHKEALILSAAFAGLAMASVVVLRSRK